MSKIPRHLLPQIPSDKIDEFIEYLNDIGISTKLEVRTVDALMPIQKHINKEKIKIFIKNPEKITKSPLIITSDDYLVDGHHRYIAARLLRLHELECLVCDCGLLEFIKISHDFDHSYVKSVHELTTYGRTKLLIELNLQKRSVT